MKFSRTYIKVSFLLAVYGYNIIFIPASWRSRWFWPWCEMCHSKLNSNGDLYDVVWFAISTKTTFGSGLQRLLMVVMKIKFYLLGFSLWRKQKIWPTQGEIGAQDCPSAIQTLRHSGSSAKGSSLTPFLVSRKQKTFMLSLPLILLSFTFCKSWLVIMYSWSTNLTIDIGNRGVGILPSRVRFWGRSFQVLRQTFPNVERWITKKINASPFPPKS